LRLTASILQFALHRGPAELFESVEGGRLKERQRMIRRRALTAAIKTEIGCHTFRAAGIMP
jgi:integrase